VATDVAIINTILDALDLFPSSNIHLIEDACKGFVPPNVTKSLETIKEKGVQFIQSGTILSQ